MYKVRNRSHSRPLQSVRYQTSTSPPCFCTDKSRTLPQKRFQAQAVWKIKDHPLICSSKPQLLPLASLLPLPSFIHNHPCWLLLQENDDSSQTLFGSWKSVNQPMEKCKISRPFEFSAQLMNSSFLTPRQRIKAVQALHISVGYMSGLFNVATLIFYRTLSKQCFGLQLPEETCCYLRNLLSAFDFLQPSGPEALHSIPLVCVMSDIRHDGSGRDQIRQHICVFAVFFFSYWYIYLEKKTTWEIKGKTTTNLNRCFPC